MRTKTQRVMIRRHEVFALALLEPANGAVKPSWWVQAAAPRIAQTLKGGPALRNKALESVS